MATLRLLSKLAAVTLTTAALASGASHASRAKLPTSYQTIVLKAPEPSLPV